MGCTLEATFTVRGGWLVRKLRQYENGVLALESEVNVRAV